MSSQSSFDEVSVVPVARSVPLVVGDEPAMREWAEELVARAGAEGVELTGDDGLLTAMMCERNQWRATTYFSECTDPPRPGTGL